MAMLLPVNYFGHATLSPRGAPLSESRGQPTFAAAYRQALLNLKEGETVPENERAMYRAAEDADRRIREERRRGDGRRHGTRDGAEAQGDAMDGQKPLYIEI
ncbi:MAG: hypothetical protein LBS32_08605 [Clostridiales Family XIII bacterium]|jgi:hypothetical protein|nr:hypothetical protein [Clostridiales Family XIII bacterium]